MIPFSKQPFFVLVLLCLASSSLGQSVPGAYELLEQVRQVYEEIDLYQDQGTIEIQPRDRSKPTRQLQFETASTSRGFRWQIEGEAGLRVFWRDGPQGWSYDASLEQYRPVDALITEMVTTFGGSVLDALVVPAALLGVDAFEDPEGAAVEGPEACGEASCWILTLSRMGGTVESSLWVDRESKLIRRVEVHFWPSESIAKGTDDDETSALIVEHQLQAVAALELAELIFEPPIEAELVEEFDLQARDDVDLAYGFSEVITVENTSMVLRAVTSKGEVIADLEAADFKVMIGKEEIPVVAVDWISPFAPPLEAFPAVSNAIPGGSARDPDPPFKARDRFIVLFVQADFNAVRIRGHLRLRHYVEKEFLPTLHPDDYVAIVTFDSHLKLWHDFTRDRESIAAALHQAIRFGGKPLARRNRRGPSLLDTFDPTAGRKIAYPEEALQMVGEALTPLAGEKDVVYLGWGMGSFDYAGVRMRASYWPAIRALHAARATVYALDATDAGAHDLAVGMRKVAADTGGTYQKTHSSKLATLATRRVAAMMQGYYVLTLDVTDAPSGKVKVRLRDRKGDLIYRPIRTAGERD